MTKWEYQVLVPKKDLISERQNMRKLGDEEWELVGILNGLLYFKRKEKA